MGVADYVLGDKPPPPELTRALNYQSWGVMDIMTLPAGMLARMNVCLNYYRALSGYRKAAAQKKTADWTKMNPEQFELVTRVLKLRRGK